MKFGGSSVANPERIKNVIEIVRGRYEQYNKVVVVCSAFGGVTDHIIKTSQLAEAKDISYKENFISIKERHIAVAEELITTSDKSLLLAELNEGLQDIEETLNGVYLLGECPDKSLAKLSSYGER